MTTQDCLNLLREIKDVTFATVDEKGRPQARIIDVMLVEEGTLIFCTARGKDFYHELLAYGHVAISGLTKNWQMVRFSGTVHRFASAAEQKYWIDRIFEANPSMKGVYPGEARYILDAFCLDSGELEYFDLSSHPIVRERFALGTATVTPKGFHISDSCIGCGTCQQLCPQGCITSGTLYHINQTNCLHCGLCFENCPVQAIRRRGEAE